jgi:hypothetical protein
VGGYALDTKPMELSRTGVCAPLFWHLLTTLCLFCLPSHHPCHWQPSTTVRYRPHPYEGLLSKRLASTIFTMWRGIGENTGVSVVPRKGEEGSGEGAPLRSHNEDSLSYAVDSLMKVGKGAGRADLPSLHGLHSQLHSQRVRWQDD